MNRDQKDIYLHGLGAIDVGQTIKDALALAPAIAQTVQLFQQPKQPTVVDNSAQYLSAFQQQQAALQQQLAQQKEQFDKQQANLQIQLAQDREAAAAQARAAQEAAARASAKTTDGDKTLVYVGVGVGAVAVIGLVAFLATRK